MKFKAADGITAIIIRERQEELMNMYKTVLRIGNFKVFNVFELIVSDVLDLNEACLKGREKAAKDKKDDACLAISVISYAGDDLFFHHLWYSYHSNREGLTAHHVEDFFNQEEKKVKKKVFKKGKTEEAYSYVKLLKVIGFDLRQNVCFC